MFFCYAETCNDRNILLCDGQHGSLAKFLRLVLYSYSSIVTPTTPTNKTAKLCATHDYIKIYTHVYIYLIIFLVEGRRVLVPHFSHMT